MNNPDSCCDCCASEILFGIISAKPLAKGLVTSTDSAICGRKSAKRSRSENGDEQLDLGLGVDLPPSKRSKSDVNADANAGIDLQCCFDRQHMAGSEEEAVAAENWETFWWQQMTEEKVIVGENPGDRGYLLFGRFGH